MNPPGSKWWDVPPGETAKNATKEIGRLDEAAEDRALLMALTDGDDAAVAWGILYTRHRPLVTSVCRQVLGASSPAVDDAVQDTFLRLHRAAGTITSPGAIRSWLRLTAKRVCLDHLTSASSRRERPAEVCPDVPAPGAVDDAVATADLVTRALSAGTPKQSWMLVQAHGMGRAHADIAEDLHSTPGSVRVQLVRARQRVRAAMGDQLWGLLPWPVWQWRQRASEALKTLEPMAAAAMMVPIVTLTLAGPLSPPAAAPETAVISHENTTSVAQQVAAPRDESAGPPAVPAPPTAQSPAAAVPATPRTMMSTPEEAAYQNPPAPLHSVTMPVTGRQMETYEQPTSPPDRAMSVGTEETGEVAGYTVREEEWEYEAVLTACAASAGVPAVTCE